MIKEKFVSLESLRGIAALSVVLFHFEPDSHLRNAFIANSWLMVDFFFVLSGFVIALNYIDRLSSVSDLLAFQKKRFFRLYPLHLIMLFVFLEIEIAKWAVEARYGIRANTAAFSQSNLTSFIANLFLVQNWTLPNLTYNYPSWSISAEFVTYAIFATSVLLVKGHKSLFFAMLFLMTIVFGSLLKISGMDTDNVSGPLRCLYSFAIGVQVFIVFDKCKDWIRLDSSLPSTFLLIASIFVVAEFGIPQFDYVELIPILFGVTILALVLTNRTAAINRYLATPFLVYLGTISYGIYMIHAAVWWIVNQSLRFFLKFSTTTAASGKTELKIDNLYLTDAIAISGILVTLTLAHFSYHVIEKRFYGHQKEKKPRARNNLSA